MNSTRLRFSFRSVIWLPLLVWGTIACGAEEDENSPPGSVGTECDPSAPRCEAGLECATLETGGGVCAFVAGAECEPDNSELQNGGCAPSAECVIPEPPRDGVSEGIAICLIAEGGECDPDDELCTDGQVCAEMASTGHRCFAPVFLVGTVMDTTNGSPIEGAQLIGIDDQGSASTQVSESDAEGRYLLEVPVVRNEDGSPADEQLTLQAGAQDYLPFPRGVRVALPISLDEGVLGDEGWVIESALTDVSLIPLPNGERYSISGRLEAAPEGTEGTPSNLTGVLIVATGPDGSFSATTDRDGTFTIFNVPNGQYEVKGYAADLQVDPSSVAVTGAPLTDVTLEESSRSTAVVSGSVQIVNAPGGSVTSVILVVRDTFEPNVARGEVPRGLRAPRTGVPDVDGNFEIRGVPDGEYVVLAAYENDALVRDPDSNISGTDFVFLTVDAERESDVTLSESFKVTEALGVLGPGTERPAPVSEAPMLRWVDDSSEDWYEVRVFDALGNEVWSNLDVPSVSGSREVAVEYDGPLEVGMYYQFRVLSWRQPGNGAAAPISATEDLRGVFFLPSE